MGNDDGCVLTPLIAHFPEVKSVVTQETAQKGTPREGKMEHVRLITCPRVAIRQVSRLFSYEWRPKHSTFRQKQHAEEYPGEINK